MNESWWENPVCWLCDYWWVLLIALVLALTAIFTRHLWLPLFGIEPAPQLGTGDIQITLTWDSTNDIDLWAEDPEGETIYYGHRQSTSGGRLDYDANAACSFVTTNPVENIFWATGEAPPGDYEIAVKYYQQCEQNGPDDYHVRLLVDDRVSEYIGSISSEGVLQQITTFSR